MNRDRLTSALAPWLRRWFVALAAWLASCGGGVGGEGTGGFAAGPVQGFGSVIVAGQRLDDGEARLSFVTDPSRPEDRPVSDLRLGMSMRAIMRDGRAMELVVAPEVVGPVETMQPETGSLRVAGQTVQVDAVPAQPTALDGLRSLDDLALGDWVEVHGTRDDDGVLRATRLARTVPGGVRVTGLASAVDSASGQLVLHGLRVSYASAVRVPAGAEPADGQPVAVFGRLEGGVLMAASVAPGGGVPDEVSRADAAGTVRDLRGLRFVLAGVPVDASAAHITGGSLQAGRSATATGRLRGGVLEASAVVLRADAEPPTVSIAAAVGGFVDAGRFTLRGVQVDVRGARFDGLSAANLGNGVRLQVQGRVQGDTVVATAVAPSPVATGEVEVQVGTLTGWSPGTGEFSLVGLAARFALAADTVFDGGTRADLADGVPVVVRGAAQGDLFRVTRVKVGAAELEVELSGIANNVEAVGASGAFEIGSTDVAWTADTRFIGNTNSAADLADGRVVRVQGVPAGPGLLQATLVDTRATQPGVVRLRGTVAGLTADGRFRIDGQLIDASQAVFEPASLASALAGAYVDVEGSLVDGTVRATRVSDP